MTLQTANGYQFVGEVECYTFKKSPAMIDIMADGRFKGQVKMPCIPGMEYPLSYIRDFVLERRPSLKRLNLEFCPSDQCV